MYQKSVRHCICRC